MRTDGAGAGTWQRCRIVIIMDLRIGNEATRYQSGLAGASFPTVITLSHDTFRIVIPKAFEATVAVSLKPRDRKMRHIRPNTVWTSTNFDSISLHTGNSAWQSPQNRSLRQFFHFD